MKGATKALERKTWRSWHPSGQRVEECQQCQVTRLLWGLAPFGDIKKREGGAFLTNFFPILTGASNTPPNTTHKGDRRHERHE